MKTDEVFFLPEPDAVGTPEARVTLFASATATAPKAVRSLQAFIAECRGETHKTAVTAVQQAAAAGDKNKVGLLKRNLPAATLSCAMTSRAKGAPERVRTHSGWLQCDFDGKENIGLDQNNMRTRLKADPHVGAVFVGPSGVGIKCAVRIDGTRHRESFDSAARYFKSEHGLTIDVACKDVERLCFLSHDPDAWCRETESQALPITADEPAVRQDITPTTRSGGAGRSIVHKTLSAATVAEMLSYITPPTEGPGEYDRWLHLVSAVAATLPPAEALAVLLAWSPDRVPNETEDKIKNRLTQVGTGTLIFHAKAGGWRGTHPETRVPRVPRVNADGTTEDVYLAPQPFPRPRLTDVLPYRRELLPPDLRDWVGDIVFRSDFQEDFVFVAAICSLGICLGSKVAVYPKRKDDWHEHANLWGMLVSRPGTMKSPALVAAMGPLRSVAARWNEAYAKALPEFQKQEAVAEIEYKAAMKKVQKLAYNGERFELPEKKNVAPPRARRLSTSDCTKEKLASLMQENPAGILCEFDELMGLVASIEADPGYLEFLLKSWGGKSAHHVDRIGRGSEFVPRACASVLGGIQPGRLRPLVAAGLDGGAGSDGFLARFQLMAWPDQPAGEFVLVDEWPNHDAKRRAQAVFDALADMDGLDFPNVNGCDTPGLRFDDDAQQLFYGWYHDLQTRLRTGAEPDAMRELLSKTPKLVPALALLLQLGRDPKSQAIDTEALENAIEISRISESHQRRLHDCATEDVNVAHLIWQKLMEGKLGLDPKGFSARDVIRPNWSGLTDAATVKAAMGALEDKYWIVPLESKPAGGAGGRPTTRYRVNPATEGLDFFA